MNFNSRNSLLLLCLIVFLRSANAAEVDFDRDVRPILSENCSFCHGPDEAQRQADLRLDSQDGAMSVIESGDREASELYQRLVAHDDEDLVMPPIDSNRKLTAQQIDTIGKWIDDGAKWTKHWAFRPIEKPPVPKVKTDFPIHNPIDAFVQARLNQNSMRPAPEADRRTLIRRLSLDLRGLPPTQKEVAAFVASNDPKAYEKLVQQMLDSPFYGQRMAWDWLDASRYADTNGYQGDRERTMWPWRDWVVQSFNQNLPFNDFTVMQLAGDLLPDATLEQKLATGFCRNHMINGEGGRIAEENRVEYVMDMTETMGTVWLGLTLNCCRCHDHKYDPITNEEYYQFFAFFNQTPVKGNGGDPQTIPVLSVPDEAQNVKLNEFAKKIADIDAKMVAHAKKIAPQQTDWEKRKTKELEGETPWTTLEPLSVFSTRQRTRVLKDKSILTAGQNPKNDTYTVTAAITGDPISGVRLEALRHPTMTKGGLARSDSGNFVLTAFEVALLDKDDNRTPIEIVSAQATFEQGGLKIENAFDDNPKSGWAVYNGKPIDQDHAGVFVFKQPVAVPDESRIEFVLRHDSVHANHNLGRFRLATTTAKEPGIAKVEDALISALKVPANQRSPEAKSEIGKAFRSSDKEYRGLQSQRDKLVKQRDSMRKSIPKVMVMEDMPEPRETFVLDRGLYNKPKDSVVAKLPEFLPASSHTDGPLNRLALAQWLVSDDNPLTARVTVNRFWQQIFGIGLVKTPEDFGRQGEIPVQMDLLNWLAADFRENGWDVKELIRTIVTSHVYRQSSRIESPSVYENDPANRLLARGARYRMPSWMLRDQALMASGLMSSADNGPAINTYQPEGIWEEASFGKKTYKRDTGEKLYRRSLYIFWRRIIAPTMLFDNASRQSCTVKLGRTNTPLQALQLLNEVTFVESARALAQLALTSNNDSDPKRLDFVMQRLLARTPTRKEQKILLAGLARTQEQFTQDPTAAEELLKVGESPHDASLDTIQHASWTAVCIAVLNLDETLNRE